MSFRLYRSPDGNPGDTGDPSAGDTGKGDAGASGNDPGKNKAGKTATDGDKTPTVEEQLAAMTKERDEFKTKHSDLSVKIGKQSDNIAVLKDFAHKIAEDPKGLMRSIAQKSGIDLYFEDPLAAKLAGDGKTAGSDDGGKAATLQPLSSDEMHKMFNQQMQSVMNPIHQELLKGRYEDWEELGEGRDTMSLAYSSGKLALPEILHLATRGRYLAEAVEKAKAIGEQEYIDSLTQKKTEQIDGAGAGSPKPTATDAVYRLTDVLDTLHAAT